MDNQMQDSIVLRAGRARKRKLLGLVLAIICLGLYIALAIILFKYFNPPRQISNLVTTKVTNDIEYMTSTNLPDVITTMDIVKSSEQSILSTIGISLIEIYTNYSLREPIEYETDGHPLGNTLFFNGALMCNYTGGDRDRQLIISGVILAMICVALYINLTVILSKRSSSQNRYRIKNQTYETINNSTVMTSNNLSDVTTSKQPITSSVQSFLETMVANQSESYTNYSIKEPLEYDINGRQLGNRFHYNLKQVCRTNGYVNSVSFRLLTNWEGTASLYIFVLSESLIVDKILYRYAINPQKNTTLWQTFKISSRTLPIHHGNFLGIGMQDSSNTNQIYVVKSIDGVTGININENTTMSDIKYLSMRGVAFSYTVVQYHNSVIL
ncbi:unnamed protein product [Rotaria sordida]|uniref:Uncharacterized protein n=1 Tax=Rotaria sordida TaxID=392033 RepID=A0A818QEF7_9BILA|nr:unnamed protein product [Rotaria sordida]